MLRGALACAPLPPLVLAGHATAGVAAALGAMLAGINDRPGGRRSSVTRIGAPALAGSLGMLLGSTAGHLAGDGATADVLLPLLFAVAALLAGAVSAAGPVASACGTQLLLAAVVGAGMPLPEPGPQRALLWLAGAGWLLLLRLCLPAPGRPAAGPYHLDGEREAVAAVYGAVADLLDAAGGPRATARRAALTAALDHAQDALDGPRLRRRPRSAAERALHARYGAALPLAEAATALAWAGEQLPPRAARGPRRLAGAVRGGGPCGPLPAPVRATPGLRALDDALLHAAEVFDRPPERTPGAGRARDRRSALRRALGPAGREYGIRVALCGGAATALGRALDHEYWYWLPATAVFLVKPDLGPLVSRVLCRALGTVIGAAVFAAVLAAPVRLVPGGPGLPLVAVVAVCGALIPVATRHFAAQTAVVTLLVLTLVVLGGEPPAAWSRVVESLLACALVLLVGHLPLPGRRGHAVRTGLEAAARAAHEYLAQVLTAPEDRAARWALRRRAYRALADARAAVEVSAAELPALARHTAGSARVAATLEDLVDTVTACAVVRDHGTAGHAAALPARHAGRLATLLTDLADAERHAGLRTTAHRLPHPHPHPVPA
ncbi:FUSC family protein [Streptomyces sp. GC420]|nr:FUSC family protein [Streptomyces sp. GC420]